MSEQEREGDDDAAGLLARERGQLGPTISAATMARYERLQALITDLPAMPAGAPPRVGWKRDVLAAIHAAAAELEIQRNPAPVRSSDGVPPTRTSTRRRRWAVTMAISAAAAVVVILLAVYRDRGGGPDARGAPTLAFELKPAERPLRSFNPSVGDTLIVRGVVEGPGELRVYDADGVERARCTVPAPDCTIDRVGTRTTLRLTIPLRVRGALRVILFTAPLGGPSGGRDADLGAADRAGIALIAQELDVD